jgi:ribosome-binding factor A
MSRPRLLAWALRIARAPPCDSAAAFAPPAALASPIALASSSSPLLSLAAFSSSSSGNKQRRDDRRQQQRRRREQAEADDDAPSTTAYRHPPREELDATLAAALGLLGGRGLRGRPPRSRAPPLPPLSSTAQEADQEEERLDQPPRRSPSAPSAAENAEAEWRARPTVGARRAASHLEQALSSALARDAACRDDLLRAHGLVVHAARRSADGREAAVLWDCFPGHEEQCALALERRAGRLRRAVATAMRGTRVPAPRLVFKLDRLPARAAAVAEALDRAERELMMASGEEEEDGSEEEDDGGGDAAPDDADRALR